MKHRSFARRCVAWAVGAALFGTSGCIQVQQAETFGDTGTAQDLGVTNDLAEDEGGGNIGPPENDVGVPPGLDTTVIGVDGVVNPDDAMDDAMDDDTGIVNPPDDVDDEHDTVVEPPDDIDDGGDTTIVDPAEDVVIPSDVPTWTDVPPTVDTWTSNDTAGPTDVFQPPACNPLTECSTGTECVPLNGFWPTNRCIVCRTLGNSVNGWVRSSGVEPNNWAWYESMPFELPLDTERTRADDLNDLRCDQDWLGWRIPFAAATTTQGEATGTVVPTTYTIVAQYLSSTAGKAKQCVRFGCGRLLQGGNYHFDAPLAQVTPQCVDHNGGTQMPSTINVPQGESRFGQPASGGTEYQCCVAASDTVLGMHHSGLPLRARLTVTVACQGDGLLGIWHGAYNAQGAQQLTACTVQPPNPDDTQCLDFMTSIRAQATSVISTDL